LDELARVIVQPGKPAYKKIVSTFGKEILLPNGELDRKKLGSVIFQDERQRKKLNAITHPAIFGELLKQAIYSFLGGCTLVFIGLSPSLVLSDEFRFSSFVRDEDYRELRVCGGCNLGGFGDSTSKIETERQLFRGRSVEQVIHLFSVQNGNFAIESKARCHWTRREKWQIIASTTTLPFPTLRNKWTH
jgi:hypothetical protein